MCPELRIEPEEFDKLIELLRRYRSDCDVAFGTNEAGEIWPWKTYGNHGRSNLKEPITCPPEILKVVAGYFIEQTRDVKDVPGGRFFFRHNYAYWKKSDGTEVIITHIKLLGEDKGKRDLFNLPGCGVNASGMKKAKPSPTRVQPRRPISFREWLENRGK